MRGSRQTAALILGLLNAALVVRGSWAGVWPLSVQFLAGLLLIAFAYLRWRTLSH